MADDALSLCLAQIAVAAGEPVADIYTHGCRTHYKADASPVTNADLAAERVILEQLAVAFPNTPVVAEECVSAGRVPPIAPRFFLVDPLDGTREFVAGRTEFTVNIALIEDRRPVAGAIYAPLLQRLWFASAAAFTAGVAPGGDVSDLGGRRRISVREAPSQGLVALVSRSHDDPETEAWLAPLRVIERRPMGSSLKFCWIAEGLADVYPRLGETREWDTAAGHAILAAAGGDVTALDGRPLGYGDVGCGFRRAGFVAVGGVRLGEGSALITPRAEAMSGAFPELSPGSAPR
ncbi:MAG TPA: 3'(2'),5'-bisphosphate nucleotidase CysQ [Beijerinckiaceae bacterium]|nr:3'(2'),5'-bisphosphate nucleotidase CysQ [Beijerinckiaceae bacterium]